MGFHVTHETSAYNAEDDAAGIICQALPAGAHHADLRLQTGGGVLADSDADADANTADADADGNANANPAPIDTEDTNTEDYNAEDHDTEDHSTEGHNAEGRCLHSSSFRLNVSAFDGIGGALFRGCLGGVKGHYGV